MIRIRRLSIGFSKLLVILNCLFFPIVFSEYDGLFVLSRESFLAGQVWRLLTYMFMHAGIVHLAFNMLALWNMGSYLEALMGARRVLIIYFVSGLVGGAWALFWIGDQPLVGASAAIFGLFGGLFYLVINARRLGLPEQILPPKQALIKSLLLNGLISLLPFVSLAGHFGGLVAGYICAALLLHNKRNQTTAV
jgi:membrane associated rhomboid family serine protease